MKNTLLELLLISLIRVLVFFLLNRLFYCLFNYPISRFLRLYSFKLFVVEVLLFGDIQNIVFVLVRNMSCTFKINSGAQYHLIGVLPVIFGGFMLISFLAYFFLQKAYNSKLSKYFLVNMYRIPGSVSLSFMLFSLKPILVGCIQALHYESPSAQLFLLAIIEFLSLLLMWFFQQKYEVFICKLLFCIDWLLYASMCLLNICFIHK